MSDPVSLRAALAVRPRITVDVARIVAALPSAAYAASTAPSIPDVAAVATAPDPRKGERLVLVTQKKGATRGEFRAFAKSKGASDLMVPAEVVFIEKVPVLGTGKIDRRALKAQYSR